MMPMMRMMRSIPRHRRSAFTLVELLTVMGILLLLSVLTVIAVGRVASDARLSSATNTVTATLGAARGLAMQRNSVILVTFIPVWDPSRPDVPQLLEAVIAEPTGRSRLFFTDGIDNISSEFRPVTGYAPRPLPEGISVAGPQLDFSGASASARNWLAPPSFANQERGQLIAIIFSPDGRVLTRLPNTTLQARHHAFINRSGDFITEDAFDQGFANPGTPGWRRFYIDQPGHEPNLQLVDSLAIFDERDARDRYVVSQWSHGGPNASPQTDTGYQQRQNELTQYITESSNRISFNRFSGVVQR